MKPKTLPGFDRVWKQLAQQGWCDAIGSLEYQRVLAKWNRDGRPGIMKNFIMQNANSRPLPNEEGESPLPRKRGSARMRQYGYLRVEIWLNEKERQAFVEKFPGESIAAKIRELLCFELRIPFRRRQRPPA